MDLRRPGGVAGIHLVNLSNAFELNADDTRNLPEGDHHPVIHNATTTVSSNADGPYQQGTRWGRTTGPHRLKLASLGSHFKPPDPQCLRLFANHAGTVEATESRPSPV